MNPRLSLTTADVQRLENCQLRTAQRRIAAVKRYLKRQPWQQITLREYCHHYALELEEAEAILSARPHKV